MKKENIIGLSVLGVLLLVIGFVFAYWYGEFKGYELGLFEAEPEPLINPEVAKCQETLQEGSRGPSVSAFQNWYNDNRAGFTSPISVDGIFGPQTRAAADAFGLPNQFELSQVDNSPCR